MVFTVSISPLWDKIAKLLSKFSKIIFAPPSKIITLIPKSFARLNPSLIAIAVAFIASAAPKSFLVFAATKRPLKSRITVPNPIALASSIMTPSILILNTLGSGVSHFSDGDSGRSLWRPSHTWATLKLLRFVACWRKSWKGLEVGFPSQAWFLWYQTSSQIDANRSRSLVGRELNSLCIHSSQAWRSRILPYACNCKLETPRAIILLHMNINLLSLKLIRLKFK